MQTKRTSIYSVQTLKNSFLIIFSVIIFNFVIPAQTVDTAFNAVPSNLSAFSGSFTVQPDRKIIISGSFQIVQGVQRSNIARLNEDGSLDTSFNCSACDFDFGNTVVQPNGKIIFAGTKAGNGNANRLRRLNEDGSIDSSFTSPFPENHDGFNPLSRVWAVQPDGKIYVSQHFSFMGDPWSYLYRLNSTGSIDTSFPRLTFSYGMGQFGQKHLLSDLKLLPDGKLMISGKHDYGFLFRVNADGTKDETFVSPVLTSIFINPTLYVGSFDIQADGKIPLVGNFSAINGVSKQGIARLNADQSVDTSYTFPLTLGNISQSTQKLQLLSDGKLLISGSFAGRIVRLNADGSLDNSFTSPANLTALNDWKLDSSERILASAGFSNQSTQLARLNSDGNRDTDFNVTFGSPPSRIYATVVTPDGKIILTGGFSLVNNVVRQRMARLNSDGSLDTSFNAGSGFNRDVYNLVAQPDGKILAAGVFETFNGTPRNSFARVNADGSLDNAFNPAIEKVSTVAIQPDGKILVGGEFTSVNGTTRTGFARLNSDGTLDNAFNPVLATSGGSSGIPLTILVQPDGKIMLGGIFSVVNGTARQNFARLNADGSLDTSFNAGASSEVRILKRQADGKYITSNRNTIDRLNTDGSDDSSFQTINFDNQFSIRDIMLQSDGTILVGGGFTRVDNDQTKKYLVRLASNGTLQPGFLPDGANEQVNTFSKQADNKIVLGGEFTSVGGLKRFGIARLNAPVPARALFDFDGDGKSDISVFRASENRWYKILSGNSQVSESVFGASGDIVAPADFDGDGKTDLAIFRPSTGTWWYLSSVDNLQHSVQFGANGDIPRPSDFDGDGKADFVIFRPTENGWYRLSSGSGVIQTNSFGTAGDKPLIGDFDGDGKSDLAVYRPSTGTWWWKHSGNGINYAAQWGNSTDIPSPADYDGDGKTDYAVYRPSEGIWYIYNSSTGQATIVRFGLAEDKPVPADYDGDGKADIAVFRPSTGVWYLLKSTEGFAGLQFGLSNDVPIANAFVP